MQMRPGVYIKQTITRLENPYKAKGIAIIAEGAPPLTVTKITTKAEAIEALTPNSNALAMAALVQEHLWCDLFIVGVEIAGSFESYKAAFDLVLGQAQAYCIVADTENKELINYAKTKLTNDEFTKLFISGCGGLQNPIEFATSINCERICFTCPQIFVSNLAVDMSPLLLAIMISKGDNISNNLAGMAVTSSFDTLTSLTENQKNNYLYNGICVFEEIGGNVCLIRAMTTKTLDVNGSYDSTYRNICVIVSVDTVKASLYNALTTKLNSANPASSTGAILSLVVCELINLLDKKVISSYEKPIVALQEADKSICNVLINVVINQGINQIYLHLNMNV